MRRAFIVELAAEDRAASDLSVGGVFIQNAFVELDDECHIVLRAGNEELTVTARAVQVLDGGAGFQIEGMTRELRERIAALLELAKRVGTIEPSRRAAAGSIPPITRRAGGRVAQGSISPIQVRVDVDTDD